MMKVPRMMSGLAMWYRSFVVVVVEVRGMVLVAVMLVIVVK